MRTRAFGKMSLMRPRSARESASGLFVLPIKRQPYFIKEKKGNHYERKVTGNQGRSTASD